MPLIGGLASTGVITGVSGDGPSVLHVQAAVSTMLVSPGLASVAFLPGARWG